MPAPHYSVFYKPDALPVPNQQRQSTEGTIHVAELNLLLQKFRTTLAVAIKLWCRGPTKTSTWLSKSSINFETRQGLREYSTCYVHSAHPATLALHRALHCHTRSLLSGRCDDASLTLGISQTSTSLILLQPEHTHMIAYHHQHHQCCLNGHFPDEPRLASYLWISQSPSIPFLHRSRREHLGL